MLNQKKITILCLILLSLVFAQCKNCSKDSVFDTFNGNITVDGNNVDVSYRVTNQDIFSFLNVLDIGIYNSFQYGADVNNSKLDAKYDVLSSTVYADSFYGPPTLTYSYFKSAADFTLNTTNNNTNITFGYSTTVFALSFLQIIEYEDTNGNQKYDEDTDKIVQNISLQNQGWQKLCTSSNNDGLTVFDIRTIQTPFVKYVDFEMQVYYSDRLGEFADDDILTPKSARVMTKVNNFPYIKNGTFIAVQTMMASASATEQATSRVINDNTFQPNNVDGIYFSWMGKTTQNDQIISSEVKAKSVADMNTLGRQIYFKGIADANISVSEIYYTIGKQNLKNFNWITAVGYGPKAQIQKSKLVLYLVLCLFGIVIVGMMAYYFVRKGRNAPSDGYTQLQA